MIEYGLQLYSVYDRLAKDFKGTIQKIAEIGYKKVETAGFYDLKAEEFKAIVNDAGLTISGSHLGLDELDADYKGIVSYLKGIGCEDYIVAWADFSPNVFDTTIEKFNKYQPMLEADGIKLHFHNHSGEFSEKNAEGLNAMEALLTKTKVGLEIDTYWAFVGKQDPVKYITDHADRIKFIHLKDGSPEGEGSVLGCGKAPVLAVREAATKLGFAMVVENEISTDDSVAEAEACFKFLSEN